MLDRSSRGCVAVLGAVVLAFGAGSAQAESARRDASAPEMRLGGTAIPPIGFLDLCERSRSLCASGDIDAPDMETLRAAAMREFWSDAFAQRRTAPAAGAEARYDWSGVFAGARRDVIVPAATISARLEAAATSVAAGSDDASAPAADEAGVAAVDADAGAMLANVAVAAGDLTLSSAETSTVAEASTAESAPAVVFALDRAGWKLVNGVNRRVNRAIRQISDDRLYGVEDFWAVPTAGRGDCEDFVLAKRQALIEAGVPAESLSIAIVETRWGESHAILLLASDRGEYVLDSLSPWVSRWDRVDYVWMQRQRPGRPFDWVTAAL